jgi:CRP-like cAMP-binding protein
VIFRNYLLSALNEADLAALSSSLMEISLGTGQVLYEYDRVVEHLYFPGTSVLSVVNVMKDGRSVETATIGFESVAGLLPALSGEPSRSMTFTQIAGSAIRLPAAKVRERLTASPALLKLLLRFTQANVAQAEQSVACNALHEVLQRLARWLLMSQDRTGNHMVPLTQDYLAVMVGAQRTTVSAAAAKLKAEGLIDYRRGRIEILDRPGLEAVACECYAAVQANFEQLRTARSE